MIAISTISNNTQMYDSNFILLKTVVPIVVSQDRRSCIFMDGFEKEDKLT